MAKKDKFSQLNRKGATSSFQETMVRAARTVADIEKKNEDAASSEAPKSAPAPSKQGAKRTPEKSSASSSASSDDGAVRMTHLSNPLIPVREYNLASEYCNNYGNMTRQDWMELAIVEKLHNDGLVDDDYFTTRCNEIRTRPPRGQRKNTKVHLNK